MASIPSFFLFYFVRKKLFCPSYFFQFFNFSRINLLNSLAVCSIILSTEIAQKKKLETNPVNIEKVNQEWNETNP